MKVRVFNRGILICVVIWTLVVAAQGHFRGMRRTADNLGKVVEESAFRDWSRKEEEPSGKEREVRDKRIEEVVSGLLGRSSTLIPRFVSVNSGANSIPNCQQESEKCLSPVCWRDWIPISCFLTVYPLNAAGSLSSGQ